MTQRSNQGIVTRVTGGSSKLTAINVDTNAEDQEYIIGGVTGSVGGESLFCIYLYANNTPIVYTLFEGIDEEGPWVQLDTGTALEVTIDPLEVTYQATGVFYSGVLRLVCNGASAGAYSVKMLAK